jgi:IclR family transcriptional regulator, KDG regulon repressor
MARIDSPHFLRAHTPIGGRVPLYCGSTGKALLAYLSDQEIKRVGKSLTAITPRTITRYDVLLKELARIRARGYATSVGEWDLSISGVAAPVFGSDGNVVASIGVTGPVERLNEAKPTKLGPQVAGVAWELSEQLGCPPSSHLRAQ